MQEKINQSPTNPEVKRIGRLLKSIRIAKGLDIYEVAEKSGLSDHTITAIEYGKYNSGIKQVSTYANAMDYEVAFIPKPTASPTV